MATAVSMPFRMYKWCVMPMGLRNSPAIHQQCVTSVLRPFIRKICHIYLDNIVIWLDTIEEHIANVKTIMNALHEARLHVNHKKTKLFCDEIDFLGHHISQCRIETEERSPEYLIGQCQNQQRKYDNFWDLYDTSMCSCPDLQYKVIY